jgi:hypothetical protein
MTNVFFELNCPGCAKRLKCPPELVGQNSTCPKCKADFYITPPQAVRIAIPDDGTATVSACWTFEETTKPIDDSIVRVASVSSTTSHGVTPVLYFRTTIRERRVDWELYFAFLEKMFSIRADSISSLFRVDKNQPLKIQVSPSETGNACFVRETWALMKEMQNAKTLYCNLSLIKHGTITFEFPIAGFFEIHTRMLSGAIAAKWTELQKFNGDIVEHILRLGPKNLQALIEALMRTGMLAQNQQSSAAQKSNVLFSAAEAFGEKFRVSEIYGTFTGNTPNNPMAIAVYNNLSAQTREAIGKLFISD